MDPYEITYIVRPDMDEEHIQGVVDALNTRLGEAGELIATYPWNPPRRRMAYPIRDFGDGYYVTTTFNYPAQELGELERGLRLNGNILRFLMVQATPANVQQSQQRAQQYQARLAGMQHGPAQAGMPQPGGIPQPVGAPQPAGAPAPVGVQQPVGAEAQSVLASQPADAASGSQSAPPTGPEPASETAAEPAPVQELATEQVPAQQPPTPEAPAEPVPEPVVTAEDTQG